MYITGMYMILVNEQYKTKFSLLYVLIVVNIFFAKSTTLVHATSMWSRGLVQQLVTFHNSYNKNSFMSRKLYAL